MLRFSFKLLNEIEIYFIGWKVKNTSLTPNFIFPLITQKIQYNANPPKKAIPRKSKYELDKFINILFRNELAG
jgi:hypothetical protein